MASNSGRRSGSSGRSTPRKRVVIGAQETVRVRYRKDAPEVESERRAKRQRAAESRPQSSSSRAGKRLSAAKRQERERRQQLLRVRRVGIVALGVVVAGLVLWAAVALYRAPIFGVEKVVVTGNHRHDTASIRAIAAIAPDATLLRLSTAAVKRRLLADPWVASATVSRDFPDTVRIEVVERKAAAVVDGGGDRLWVVSTDGRWLSRRSREDTGLVLVRDVEKVSPVPGKRVEEPEVRNAVKVVLGLSRELRGDVSLVSAPTVDETALHTKKNVEVFVGEAVRMTEKDRIIRAILREQKGRVVYINVRVLDRPTWRGLEGEGE